MKKMKQTFCLLLCVCLCLTLCACSNKAETENNLPLISNNTASDSQQIESNLQTADLRTIEGWVSKEIKFPDWVLEHLGMTDVIGDSMYIAVTSKESSIALAVYDTINNSWQRHNINCEGIESPIIRSFSVNDDNIFALLMSNTSQKFYISYSNLNTGNSSCEIISYYDSSDIFPNAVISLSNESCLINDGQNTYVLNRDGVSLEKTNIKIIGDGSYFKVNGNIYMNTDNGLAPLDISSLSLGEAIKISEPCLNSNAGQFLVFAGEYLKNVDPVSGKSENIFQWSEVALSSMGMYGKGGLQNHEGNIFYLENSLIKVHPGHRTVKSTLTLAIFADSSTEDYENWQDNYSCSESLKNAIIRFNNSDPEYKIEVKPIIYNGEEELNKALMEIATQSDVDLIDTGALPEGAIGSSLLVDMLPYLDNDNEISREDFIPVLLDAMLENGGLYEYTDRFSLLTMYAPVSIFPDKDSFNVQNIITKINENHDLLVPEDWNYLIDYFAWGASAEFCNWKDGSCDFTNPVFISWLELLKNMPSELINITRDKPSLFEIDLEFQVNSGLFARQLLGGEYIVTGFPEANGTGSYFMKLGNSSGYIGSVDRSKNISTLGMCTEIGIMASSIDYDGAWRFVKTLMLGEPSPDLMNGIPVMKAGFERAIECRLNESETSGDSTLNFNQYDADYLRYVVYNSTGLVHRDQALMDIFRTEINAFLGGKGSAEDCANQIQSRISIYMAERS